MKKIVNNLAILLAMTLSLTACSAGSATTTSTTAAQTTASLTQTASTSATTPAATSASNTSAEETAYPYEVEASGQSVTIEKEPQRIVSLSPTFTEIVYALGAGEKLVGRTDYCDYPAEAGSVPSVGPMVTPSVEKIIEFEPDLVLVSFLDEALLDQIEQTGAVVVQIEAGNTLEGSYQNMQEIARILNASTEAKALIKRIRADIAAVSDKVKGKTPPTAYYVAGFGKDGDYTAGSDTFMHELITAAGGDNAAKDVTGWNYTSEKLLEKDPDYIFIGSMAQLTDAFKTTEPYAGLTAVKEGRVIEVDDNLISREGPRMGKAVEELARALYPELFK